MASKQKIADLTTNLNAVVSHPEFTGLLEQLEKAPEGNRKQFIRDNMNPDALRQKGIPVQPGLRSVVRYFENPHAAVITSEAIVTSDSATPRVEEFQAIGDTTVCVSFGVGLCVSVGSTVET
jgi:hypothetical protein